MKNRRRVFITRRIPDAGLEALRARKDLTVSIYQKDTIIPRKILLAGVKGADAVLSLLTERIDDELLDVAGAQLRVVSNMAVGFDNIDLAACARRGVMVTNTPGVLTDAVAEHTFALIMAVCRRIPESDRYVRAGRYKGWGPLMLLGTELKGKTLGIIGLGRIGMGVAQRAGRGMGMRIIYNDVRRDENFEKTSMASFGSTEDVLRNADVVSIHVPLLASTRHLIDAKRLALMKKTAYLVNTSRGPIIDEKALVAALKKKVIAGAALDVFENEPVLAPGLARLENVVLTPHTASATIEARSAMARIAAQGIIDVFDGKTPQYVVMPKA